MIRVLLTTTCLLALSACASTPPDTGTSSATVSPAPDAPAAPAATCNADAVTPFIGKPADAQTAEQVRLAAGATSMRVLAPGQPATMDYQANRLDLMVDANQVITSATCG